MIKGCFVCKKTSDRLDYVFAKNRKEFVENELSICPNVINEDNLEENRNFLFDVEVIFCTWDMVSYTEEQIREFFPNLKIIFYAAGSIQYFARPFFTCGVRIVSAWGIMAIPVAQFTVANIVLANKGAFRAADLYRNESFADGKKHATVLMPGTYKTKVGILGAGMIGKLVIKMLQDYTVDLMVFDPFLSDEKAMKLNIKKYSLEEIFSQCQTISNHIANNEQTVGMLNYSLFSLMRDNAVFLNTGRGAQVVEADLVQALREKPNRYAILDVTYPEPSSKEHDFWTLPNITLFPHIAGYAADEVLLFSDGMIKEFINYKNGIPVEFEVTLDMLKTMA